MKVGSVSLIEGDQPEVLRTTIEEKVQGGRSVLVLSGDALEMSSMQWDSLAQIGGNAVFGGVFPQVIYNGRNLERASIVIGLDEKPATMLIAGLDDPSTSFEEQLRNAPAEIVDAESLIIIVDGLSPRISDFIEAVYDAFGPEKHYIGGGAGSLSFMPKPCVIGDGRIRKGEAILIAIDVKIPVGLQHGWEKIAGPFIVTAAEKNMVIELDYAPAYDVYKEAIWLSSGIELTRESFFEIAKGFPFGIERVDGSVLVRDPVTVLDTRLVCVGELPMNSVVYLLEGTADNLLAAATEGARTVLRAKELRRVPVMPFLIDCISRVLFLGDQFTRELDAVRQAQRSGGQPIVGVLTLGEIANNGSHALEFHNKTFVLTGIRAA